MAVFILKEKVLAWRYLISIFMPDHLLSPLRIFIDVDWVKIIHISPKYWPNQKLAKIYLTYCIYYLMRKHLTICSSCATYHFWKKLWLLTISTRFFWYLLRPNCTRDSEWLKNTYLKIGKLPISKLQKEQASNLTHWIWVTSCCFRWRYALICKLGAKHKFKTICFDLFTHSIFESKLEPSDVNVYCQ